MRNEPEMLDLILNTARADGRVRAVIMNGSRVNPDAPRDPFQDYDIVYVVTDVDSFKAEPDWIDVFGARMIMQLPDDMGDGPSAAGSYAYLMQFADGNRIDLTLWPRANLTALGRDSLSVLLLDKDGVIEPFLPPHNGDYLPQPPTAKEFADCCNEFLWVMPYIAKGLWRDELPYALFHRDVVVREQLVKMLMWQIGVQTDFRVSPGKNGKYFARLLPAAQWELYLQTYGPAEDAATWDTVERMCRIFRETALAVAARMGFDYPHGDDARVSAHLAHVRVLPRDAVDIDPVLDVST
ncbi:MAG: aminoglycoside 6-adenylyltransferase [Caldilineaceae bacterium]|nr:aminoglycoside 6-adenylyltransferase [Caldilineaceae bacterium]